MSWLVAALRAYPTGPVTSGPGELERQARQSRHSGSDDACVLWHSSAAC